MSDWLAQPENAAVISVLTSTATALISVLAAIWIATKVYVRQKKVDARSLLSVEKKAAFTAYFEATADLHTELRAALYRARHLNEQEAHLREAERKLHLVYRTQDTLALNAEPNAIQVCRDYTIALLGLRAHTRASVLQTPLNDRYAHLNGPEDAIQSVLDSKERALICARSDVLGRSQADSKAALEGLFERKDVSQIPI